MFDNILEISKKAARNGRVPVKIALLKIHGDKSGTNRNGIHWDERFVASAMDTARSMPICASFADAGKSAPLDHGMTGMERGPDGLKEPVFEDSEVVGVVEEPSIESVGGERMLCGSGYLFSQRYPNFVKWVRKNHAAGKIATSVEITGLPENGNKIVFMEDAPTAEFRTPKEFAFTGTSFLSVEPADPDAVLLEVAQKKTERKEEDMEEKDLREAVRSAILELNARDEERAREIAELKAGLAEKDAEIAELNESLVAAREKAGKLETAGEAWKSEKDGLLSELNALKEKAKIAELEDALSGFTEEERGYAEGEISAFRDRPLDGDVGSVVSRIHERIGIAAKKAEDAERVAEQNSAAGSAVPDIFSDVCPAGSPGAEDTNIF